MKKGIGYEEKILKIEEYMDSYEKTWPLNGVLLIAKDGEIIFNNAYGMSNIEHDISNTIESKFLVCSITKSFTAVSIMMLVERGIINLEDNIRKHLPEYSETGEKITVYHLLTNTSGIPNYSNDFNWFNKDERLIFSQEEMIELFKDKPLDFEPGEKGGYSNSGYFLLGMIIEKVTGKTYEEFLIENIFEPLNMKNTGIYHQDKVIKNRAYPYDLNGADFINGRIVEMGNIFSSGSIYSTGTDLLIWDKALFSYKLIKNQTLNDMFKSYRTIDEETPYGTGFFATEIFGRKRVGHEGGLNGYLTQWYHYIEENICIIYLGNTIQNIWKISDDIAAIIFDEKYELPKRPEFKELDSKQYNNFVGEYMHPKDFLIKVTKENDKLFLKIDTDNKYEIYSISENVFTHPLVDEIYKFEKEDDVQDYDFVIYSSKCKKVK